MAFFMKANVRVCACVSPSSSNRNLHEGTEQGWAPKQETFHLPPLLVTRKGGEIAKTTPPPEDDVARDQKLPDRDDLLASDGSDDNSEDEWLLDVEKSKWGKKVRGPLN